MAEMWVSAAEVAALGETLAGISAALETHARLAEVDGWAFGPGDTASSLSQVVSNWQHRRLEMCRHLDELSRAAQAAGGAYLRLEADVTMLIAGGGTA
jgi:hypothetical protein